MAQQPRSAASFIWPNLAHEAEPQPQRREPVSPLAAAMYPGHLPKPPASFGPVPFGNEVALNVGKGGCGTGRTLYGQAGSQGTHGSANPGSPLPNPRRNALESE